MELYKLKKQLLRKHLALLSEDFTGKIKTKDKSCPLSHLPINTLSSALPDMLHFLQRTGGDGRCFTVMKQP